MPTRPKSTRVFVVEDHLVMHNMLCEAVERAPGCTLVGSARSAERALIELSESKADLVLVDVSLPQMSGVDLVRVLRKRMPALRCLMVSGHIEASYAEQALAAGARGYVLKGRPDDLESALSTCAGGNIYLSDPLRVKLEKGDAAN